MSTELTPAHAFKVNRDDDQDPSPQEIEPVEDDENKKVLSLQEKLSLDNWQHLSQAILGEGRVKHAPIEGDDDDEKKEKLMKQKLVDDPFQERLKPLSKDRFADLPTCWVLKAHGDPQATNRHLFKKDTLTHEVVISLRSLVWPGQVHIHKDALLTSIYVGDGQKYSPAEQYFPKFPYLVQVEPAERKEVSEPNGPEEADKKDA